uniref:Putative B5 receptor 100 n=1 Tax=Schistosoma japonicum TaxID=6182 RepID=C7TZE6_SCHJA|nr:putative B5 receptor 100 [Schistosoma japonicum]
MSIAVFIDGTDAQQVTELKKFLKSYGAKVLDNTECSDANWPDELIKCIKFLNVCWKDESIAESDAKDVLTSVASMFIQLPPNKLIEAVPLFCEKLLDFSGDNIRRHKNKLFPLNLLFWGLNPKSHPRYEIFLTLIECAEKMGVLNEVITDPKKVASWLSECDCTVEECQKVWQKLYDAHIALGENRKAIEAMIYLLSTYNEVTAVNARQNAINVARSVFIITRSVVCCKTSSISGRRTCS